MAETILKNKETEPTYIASGNEHSTKANRKLLDTVDRWAEDEDEVEQWLSRGADPNARSRNDQSTPLHFAAERDHVNIARLLLEHGADPNAVRSDQSTPLHLAVEKGDVEFISLLLDKKATLNVLNRSHQTPLRLAAANGEHDITGFLLERDGIDVNTPDTRGETVLHDACAKGWEDIVEQLLRKEAAVDVQDDKERSPMHDASMCDNVEVVRKLIAAEASVDIRDASGRTPIYEASAHGNADIAEELITGGASVNIHDMTGKTPLHVASAHDYARVVEVLLAHNASINAVAHDGSKPLHEALRFGAMHAADQLLGYDAETNIQNTLTNGNGRTDTLEPPWDELLHTVHRKDVMELGLSSPPDNDERREVCEGLQAAVWPWPPMPFVLATPTVQELLHGKPSLLVEKGSNVGATWIHIPANNRAWIEDVFKILHASEQPDKHDHVADSAGQGQESEESQSESTHSTDFQQRGKREHDANRRRKLLSILAFIRSEFDSRRTVTPRRMQTEQGLSYGRVRSIPTRTQKDNMVALAVGYEAVLDLDQIDRPANAEELPIIDIDMRKPYYDRRKAQEVEEKAVMDGAEHRRVKKEKSTKKNDNPEKDPETLFAKKVKEYTVDEGGTPVETEMNYTKLMEKLRAVYEQVDVPVSLDEYFHESIDKDELNVRNGDQVISRFIARQRAETDGTTDLQVGRAMADDLQHDASPSQLEAGLGNPFHTAEAAEHFRQRIITVPRFWIWKVDKNTIVTSFPQRWDETSRQGHLPRAIWKGLTETVLNKQSILGDEVQLDADDMLKEIVQACLQFRPSFRLMGKEYTYPDVFASEIAFVSREVTRFYRHYKNALGNSVQDFSRSIKLATESLITVDDILSEITMIRRVYRDQGRIMLSLNTGNKRETKSPASLNYDTNEWGYEGMRSTEDKHIIARLKHLEKDAHMVRKSITTLLDLRQRQVAIEMALSSEVQSDTLFRQSSILLIFTLATVLFTPLSWVSSLMALNIDDFTPDSWPQSRVIGASFGSVSDTIALCAVGLAVYWTHQDYLMNSKKPGSS
ncbi:hypothetical protein DL769_004250 [Monosporascus sp. CRB-8-3]|nr:hypothetical protein DL769_004250 [Monosporascus sp. CRB-8-3]